MLRFDLDPEDPQGDRRLAGELRPSAPRADARFLRGALALQVSPQYRPLISVPGSPDECMEGA